jgi:DNA-binding NarL/FixJ family response regulator
LILSDTRFLREGLVEILGRNQAVTSADDLGEALEMLLAAPRDMVLLDAAFPDGLVAVRRIRELAPDVRIVALAVAETAENVIAWAEAGVTGYVPRTAALSDLLAMLQSIMLGEQACSAQVASGLLRRIAKPAGASIERPNGLSSPALTEREAQIIQLIVQGLSNKEIARRLNIGLATTKSHVHNLLTKLKLERRGQAALWMREHRTDCATLAS